MSQREIILKLLKENKKVTLRMLFDSGTAYTGRNRISELRKDGYSISQHNGETPSDNYYILEREPVQVEKIPCCLTVRTERPTTPAQVKFDESGQAVMGL